MCEGIAAQRRLGSLGLGTENFMNIEEMEATAKMSCDSSHGEDAKRLDPSKQLHEDEEENNGISSHQRFATDDVSGTPLDPRLVTKARK